MRWFVEISSLGKNASPSTTLCVEAPQWQPALQKARVLRGDDGALSNFSIELLEDGYRAIDPASRLRYVVRKAPDDAVLTNGTASSVGTPHTPGPVGTPHSAAPSAAPRPAGNSEAPGSGGDTPHSGAEAQSKKRATAQTMGYASVGAAVVATQEPAPSQKRAPATATYASTGAAAVREAPKPQSTAPRPAPIPADAVPPAPVAVATPRTAGPVATPQTGMPVGYRVLHKREDEPSARSPLTYREVAYVISEGTTDAAAGDFLLERFSEVSRTLTAAKRGKLINLAVFDHAYKGRPERPPLATLSWKDWKGPEPEVRFPQRDGPGNTPTPLAAPAQLQQVAARPPDPTPAAATETKARSVPPEPAAPPVSAGAKPVSDRQPRRLTPRPGSVGTPHTPGPVGSQAPPSLRLAGDELLAELFEAFSDLQFLNDTLAGADFVLALTLEKLPSEVGVVSLFDINKREFVLVRQSGGPRSAVLSRIPEKAPIAQSAMRSHRAVVVPDAVADERAHDERWKAMGVELRSLVCAPVEVGGRYLGLIELANPLDNQGFTDGDGHALTYIGQQFAEFVATHGTITDPEQILQGSKGHR